MCVSVLQKGPFGKVCVFASTLCTYDLKKGDLFVLSCAMVRRVCLGSVGYCYVSSVVECGLFLESMSGFVYC